MEPHRDPASLHSWWGHEEASLVVPVLPAAVFAVVDDHARLSSHMSQGSWMMAGGSMDVSVDAGHGRQVGSHIRLTGSVLGISLRLDEVVTEREPPHRKAWQTEGDVKLLVIGRYRMTVAVTPEGSGSRLRVAIDYELPERGAWLGRLFGGLYARWCVRRMTDDVSRALRAG